ncbi:MAG TPA: hypothetical protein PL180_07125 [Spirochaetota bacterium]|nr:hypothetical protein [Spirochaetota bacterium]HPL16443.1 hypothetical protein [Spirochaetota bacterium]HQJ70516.1 hypothetical protein [Spirochaetota bacterium]HRS76620.1 hypothetical protein [Spirochaetota bacterium]HRT74073.1 hypothetical protein [Spirochaetota bacterium]
MKRTCFSIIFFFLLAGTRLTAGLMINEFVTNTASDWVELTLTGSAKEKRDISRLFVTAYYGRNEPLSADPVTIYSYDRPETPYDDRFVVVHLTRPDEPDETDLTGDTNGNGHIDVYCNNYYASLWNTEGVIAVDTDDDPGNGGIIDFVYYSNRDGSPNETVASYVERARSAGQWKTAPGPDIQAGAVYIGKDGLMSHMSVSRKSAADSNGPADFAISNYQTPGKENMTVPLFMGMRLFKPLRKTVTIIPGHRFFGSGAIPLFVFFPCCLKLRVFSATGIMIHESPLFVSVNPGFFNLYWIPALQSSRAATGLYLCKIEAVNPSLRLTGEEVIYIVLNRYQ